MHFEQLVGRCLLGGGLGVLALVDVPTSPTRSVVLAPEAEPASPLRNRLRTATKFRGDLAIRQTRVDVQPFEGFPVAPGSADGIHLDEYIRTHRLDAYDEYGRQPLLTSQMGGRPSTNGVRAWMYLATVPCHHSECPHGNDPDTCEFLDYSKSSQCPSSRSPHQVRTGSITWQLNRGIPPERVSERVNTSIRAQLCHYDQPSKMEARRERRRDLVDRLKFADEEGMDG